MVSYQTKPPYGSSGHKRVNLCMAKHLYVLTGFSSSKLLAIAQSDYSNKHVAFLSLPEKCDAKQCLK